MLYHQREWKDDRKKRYRPPGRRKFSTALEGLPDGLFGDLPDGKARFVARLCRLRESKHEVQPEIEASGWDVFPAILGEGYGVEMVSRLSE